MKKFLVVLTILAVSLAGGSAFAASIKVDDDTFASFGTRALIWVQANEDADPKGTGNSLDAAVRHARIYFSGQVTNQVKFGFNYDMTRGVWDNNSLIGTIVGNVVGPPPTAGVLAPGGSQINMGGPVATAGVTDGFITLDFAKELKIMAGVYRMAVSRIALQDTYQYILPHGPSVAPGDTLSNLRNYRSGGVTLWGDLMDGMLRYNVGIWDGSYTAMGPGGIETGPDRGAVVADANPQDKPAYSARLVVNFLDPEKGYTCPGCYLGKAKVANVGIGYLMQDYVGGDVLIAAGPGTAGRYAPASVTPGLTYTVKTIDAFYDAAGLTAEAAYFIYDADQGVKPTAYYAQLAYAMDKIQPAVRYEKLDDDGDGSANYKQYVAGVNYLMDGHNAKVGLEYLKNDPNTGSSSDTWTVQLQVQF